MFYVAAAEYAALAEIYRMMHITERSFHWVKNWYLLTRKSNNFLGSQWAGGLVLVVFTVIALLLANFGPTRDIYHHILNSEFGITLNRFVFSMSVEEWVNDALMAVFFFVVGLEIKREMLAGDLSNVKKATLPIAAAVGGMIVPALIYALFNRGTEFSAGWGIPMATDIAFAIGVLSLLGKRVPMSLKVFLTALAIVDDLGAILVIALFYTSQIDFVMLGIGLAILCVLFYMNKQGVNYIPFYIIPGIFVWYTFLNSGIHATIAGVLVAMTIPTKPRFSKKYFLHKVRYFLEEFRHYDKEDKEVLANHQQFSSLMKLRLVASSTVSPAQKLEHALNPLVTFLIVPVFALANAGVVFTGLSDLLIFDTTQGAGIYFGLLVGKPLGIFLFSWLTIKSRLAVMPENSSWGCLFGVACLGGIGFTMSIFIDNLAFFGTPYVDPGKIAVLLASLSAAIVGGIILNALSKGSKGECAGRVLQKGKSRAAKKTA